MLHPSQVIWHTISIARERHMSNLPPGCTDQTIDDAMGGECEVCGKDTDDCECDRSNDFAIRYQWLREQWRAGK